MIKTIRIQNFRSLQDVTLNLQDVNLLIGPNNSGKSNLLKAFEFLGNFYKNRLNYSKIEMDKMFYLKKISDRFDGEINHPPIVFTLKAGRLIYSVEFFGYRNDGKFMVGQFFGKLHENSNSENFYILDNYDLDKLKYIFSDFVIQNDYSLYHRYFSQYTSVNKLVKDSENFTVEVKRSGSLQEGKYRSTHAFASSYFEFDEKKIIKNICLEISNLGLYSVNISDLKKPYPTLADDYSVKPDASNLVAFLDNMRDNKPDIMEAINSSLNECIKEFKSISLEKVALPENHDLRKIHGDKTFKRLGVRDIYSQTYWADELSDGTLYFLALLAIIHQPNPPKLLMIEEPENGIHPRRIKELMDYFFEIAEKQEVQVIMTTHSTVVIDQFTDLPESVFIFDKKEQATTVRNLKADIIAEDEKQSKKLNVPKLDLSQSLGDHWASGLIGGVPR